MTVTFRTVVLHLTPTPLGLLGERWKTEHTCNLCHSRVDGDQLVAHARGHEDAGAPMSGLPLRHRLGHNDAHRFRAQP